MLANTCGQSWASSQPSHHLHNTLSLLQLYAAIRTCRSAGGDDGVLEEYAEFLMNFSSWLGAYISADHALRLWACLVENPVHEQDRYRSACQTSRVVNALVHLGAGETVFR